MKTKNWMVVISLLAFSPLAMAGGASGSGNGGGGVQKNGRYMTFYSAGLYTEPTPAQNALEVPSLKDLISTIDGFQFVSNSTKDDLENVLLPSDEHKYYRVDANHFGPILQKRLLEEFRRVTHVPEQELTLYALTDTNQGITYLLPNFFKLSQLDQMTILFHESYWLIHPNTTYSDVVSAEMAFEAVLDHPQDQLRIFDFMKYFSTSQDRFLYAMKTDINSGALSPLVQNGNEIRLVDLIGENAIQCSQQVANETNGDRTDNIFWTDVFHEGNEIRPGPQAPECLKYVITNLKKLMMQYPKSLFLQAFLDEANANRVCDESSRTEWQRTETTVLELNATDAGFTQGYVNLGLKYGVYLGDDGMIGFRF